MSFKDLNAQEFKEAIASDPNAVVLDVRTPSEIAEGEVPGHTMINIMDPNFANRISALDKSKSYYVYCRSGGRSVSACQFMHSQGFANLYNMLGGINAWNQL